MYAYIAEQRDAADRVMFPVLLSVGVDHKEVVAMSARAAFDEWLDAPPAQQQRYEQAVVRALTG